MESPRTPDASDPDAGTSTDRPRATGDFLTESLSSLALHPRLVDEIQDDTLDDIARSLFSELCEGEGQHSEALDRALIMKHLRAALLAKDAELDKLRKENEELKARVVSHS